MKLSLAVSILILAIAAGLGWHGHQQLSTVRATHEKLSAEAARLGISDSGNAAAPAVATKHAIREDKQAEAKKVAADFIAFAREMEAIEERGEKPDAETMKRVMSFLDRIFSLDASQMKTLIAEFRDARDLKDQTRQGFVMFAVMSLSNDHPQAAIALFTESGDLLGDNAMMGKHIIGGALANWAKDDPMGALEWVRKNGKKHPDLINEDTKASLLAGVAAKDPKLAFTLISDIYGADADSDRQSAISRIVSAARTPEDRTLVLAALRDYAAGLKDDAARGNTLKQGIRELAFGGYRQSGFESTTAWLENAGLTPDELATATESMPHAVKLDDTGRWIEWLGDSGLPEKTAKDRAYQLASGWTQQDYQAAGKWLAAAPDSPEKQSAVRAYAEKVFPYEPDIAIQWALTLPPGKDRTETFRQIHKSMPKDNDDQKATAEAFAKEHGVKR